MSQLATEKPKAIAKNDGIEKIEAAMLNMDQIDCPVAHHFGPGIYIREVTLPKGGIIVGHAQRFEHLNVMLSGKIALIDNGEVRMLQAPMVFVGKPGRKICYVMETCVWQNIYATEETDIETLENTYLDKSETWLAHEDHLKDFRHANRQEDREDFITMLSEFGLDADVVRGISENEKDQIPMPSDWAVATSVRSSDIEGKGLFLSWPVPKDTIIAPARLNGFRTPAGRYVNHSKTPNCKFVKMDNDDIFLVAINDIDGCLGGTNGEELTVDYRQALSLSGIGET